MAGSRSLRVPLHVPEIDWLKGFAILCVVCIHAKIYEYSYFHEFVINRAVPIFLVLLGVTTEFFFRSHAADTVEKRLTSWYEGRFLRLLPPVWAMSAAWLAAVFALHRAADYHVGPGEAFLTFLGFSPWIGTAWFITLVLQLVLILPALRWLFLKVGWFVVLPVTAFVCGYCVWIVWDIVGFGLAHLTRNVPEPGWFYLWVFAPRIFWHLAAGMFIARAWSGRPEPYFAWVGAGVWLGGTVLSLTYPFSPAEVYLGPVRQQITGYLLDVPLTIALLGLFGAVRKYETSPPLRFLAFCGKASWGIYLGHLLVHELVHLARIAPETSTDGVRDGYGLFLLASGIGLAVLGGKVRKLVVRAAPPRAAV
jgi:peptidoglycan/LPS O-acetylase OafA/YrhL